MADIMPESQICRTCLKCKSTEEMISVFFKSCDEESLATMLKFFTSTKIRKNDGLPYFICALCAKNIKIAYSFKQQCEDSYAKLLQCMPQENPEEEEEPVTSKFADQLTQTEEITFHPCEMCDLKFLNEETLRDHRYIHLQLRSDFKCRSCEKVYIRLSHLQRHISCVHPEIAGVKSLCIRQKCPICNKQFARPDHYKRHISEVHGFTNQDLSGLPSEIPFNFEQHILPDNFGEVMVKSEPMDEYSECLYPDGVQNSSTETPSIPVEVKIDEMHSCNICQQPFGSLKKLAQHIRKECRVAAVRLHKCLKCEKSFKRPSHLRRHEITHLDVKPFKCDNCEKRFSRKEHLKIHFVGHHAKQLSMLEAICELKSAGGRLDGEAGESSTINDAFFDVNASS